MREEMERGGLKMLVVGLLTLLLIFSVVQAVQIGTMIVSDGTDTHPVQVQSVQSSQPAAQQTRQTTQSAPSMVGGC